jgi:opacity protein-like surface antigen
VIKKVSALIAGAILCVAAMASANGDQPTKFTVRLENTTKPDAFTASNGVKWSVAYSPGTAVVHTVNAPIFSAGKKDRGKGLEAQSEDGDPSMLAKSLKGAKGIKSVAVFNTPVGARGPGPITPGRRLRNNRLRRAGRALIANVDDGAIERLVLRRR